MIVSFALCKLAPGRNYRTMVLIYLLLSLVASIFFNEAYEVLIRKKNISI